jgi:DNA-binding GntR family transcriptional regulator
MDGLEIDYQAPLSPHRQIAAWLRKRIDTGEFPPGKRLPSENDIQQLTGVAATTVRRAIALLREQGIVYTVPGRGTYAGQPPDQT